MKIYFRVRLICVLLMFKVLWQYASELQIWLYIHNLPKQSSKQTNKHMVCGRHSQTSGEMELWQLKTKQPLDTSAHAAPHSNVMENCKQELSWISLAFTPVHTEARYNSSWSAEDEVVEQVQQELGLKIMSCWTEGCHRRCVWWTMKWQRLWYCVPSGWLHVLRESLTAFGDEHRNSHWTFTVFYCTAVT